MRSGQYNTNPKEVYALELEKLQFCFSKMHEMGENISEVNRVAWKQIEHLRQFNFLLEEALMVGDALLKIGS
ncbi:MAG: hypothetical protein HY863_15675 [Chloroflexi bacterium]|nr:hypothetical protein [Chloroflexota bacterium]